MQEEPQPKSTDNGVLDGELSALRITALQVHEMFLELKAVGFKHADALQLIGIMLTSGVLFNPSSTFGYAIEEMDFNDEEDETLEYGDGEDGETLF
jgi:hypothetical protein